MNIDDIKSEPIARIIANVIDHLYSKKQLEVIIENSRGLPSRRYPENEIKIMREMIAEEYYSLK